MNADVRLPLDRLIPALRLGDPDAFAVLVREATGLVRTSILHYARCPEDVEELVSDTFLRAHRCIAGFRGESSLQTWLYRIAGNLAKNKYHYWRRRGREITCSLDLPIGSKGERIHEVVADSREDHREEIEIAEFEASFRAALLILRDKDRAILSLLVDEHLQYEEIGARLRIPIGTVKSRVARARIELRRAMAEREAA